MKLLFLAVFVILLSLWIVFLFHYPIVGIGFAAAIIAALFIMDKYFKK